MQITTGSTKSGVKILNVFLDLKPCPVNLHEKNSRISLIILTIITVTGAILRFYNYSTLSLFNDELSAMVRLRFSTFHDLIVYGVMTDMHPAGVQLFLFAVTRLFGTSEAVIRLPFVLAGIASIPLIYLIGKKWFGEPTGLAAAAGLAVLQYPVNYSQLARPYSMGLFFTLLLVFFMNEIIGTPGRKTKNIFFAGFIFSGAACMYIHYFSFLFAAIAGFTGIFLVPKESLKKYLLCGLAMVLLAAPHFPVYSHQLQVGGLGGPGGWLGPPDEKTFGNYISYIFNDSTWLYRIFIGTGIISFILYRKSLDFSKYHLVSLLFFLLPFLIAYYYSIYKNPVLQFSILLFSFPYALILLFSFLPADLSRAKLLTVVSILLFTGCFSTVVEKKYYTTEHFGVFRELAVRTIELNNQYGDQNITNTFNVFEPYYINYYFSKFKRPVKLAQYRCMEPDSLAALRDIVASSSTPYFLHAWSNTFDPPEVEDIIMNHYPFRIEHDAHFNSAISFYSRKPLGSNTSPKYVYTAVHDFESYKWPNDPNYMSRLHVHAGDYASSLSGMEYGNTFTSSLKDMGFVPGDILSVSVWVYSPEKITGAVMVATVEDHFGKPVCWESGSMDRFNRQPAQWQQVFFTCKINGNNQHDKLKVFPWNVNKKDIWIDDLEIALRRP